MKKLFSIVATCCLYLVCFGQYSYQNINSELITKSLAGTVQDNNGSLVVYGTFNSSVTLGSFTVTNSTPQNPAGQQQLTSFIGKKSNGNFVWLSWIDLLPGSNFSSGAYILNSATDVSGNILVTGMFWGKAKFGDVTLTSTKYSTDLFLSKLSPNGIFLWATLLGNANDDCNGNEMGTSVTTDNIGNVYVTGKTYDLVLKNTNACMCAPNSPVSSAVIAKFSPAGVKQWDRRYAPYQPSRNYCNTGTYGARIVSDGTNTYLTGPMTGTVKFGKITLNTGSDTILNTFILKSDANGNPVWAKSITNEKNGVNSMIFSNNNLYLIGYFSAPGTLNFGGHVLSATASGTGWLTKYDLSGNCNWASLPGLQSANGNLIAHPNGNLAIMRDWVLKEYSTVDGTEVNSTASSNTENAKLNGLPKLSRTSTGYVITENLQGFYDYGGITVSSTQPVGGAYYDMILIEYSTSPPPIANLTITATESSSKVILYPNPAINQITIRNTNNKTLGNITIYDALGKMIYQKFVSNSQTMIDVKNFSAGFYYLRSDQLQATIKFIKQ